MASLQAKNDSITISGTFLLEVLQKIHIDTFYQTTYYNYLHYYNDYLVLCGLKWYIDTREYYLALTLELADTPRMSSQSIWCSV